MLSHLGPIIPILRNRLEKDFAIARRMLRHILEHRDEHSKQLFIIRGFLYQIFTDENAFPRPVLGNIRQQKVTCPLVYLLASEPIEKHLILQF